MATMTEDIAALEARLTAALSRIAGHVDAWPTTGQAPAEAAEPAQEQVAMAFADGAADGDSDVATLKQELEDERTANAQLQNRVRQIKKRQEEKLQAIEAAEAKATALEEELAAVRAKVDAVERQNGKLKRTSEDMRQTLQAVKVADGAPDAHLINTAMMAELEALRAERASDAQEIKELVAALEPMLAKGAKSA